MKKIFLIILALYYQVNIQAQDTLSKLNTDIPKFDLNKDGVAPIVLSFDTLKVNVLYKQTLNWIQETYKNPEKVLKANVENEKIRIDGIKMNAWFYKGMGTTIWYDVEYSFYIEFKDNKMRLSFSFGDTWTGGTKSYVDYSKLYKENGELYKMYKNTKSGMDQMMNELSISLYKYLKEVKKSDW